MRKRISAQIPKLIITLLDYTVHEGPNKNLVDHYKVINSQKKKILSFFQRNILILQRVCIFTSHFDLLYNSVYSLLKADSVSKTIFLELLDDFVIENQLDQPPPELVHDYLAHLRSEGLFSQFEIAVTHLPIESLDLHQVNLRVRVFNQRFFFQILIKFFR